METDPTAPRDTAPGAGAPKDIDAYIARFPEAVRERLEEIRATIRKAAPDAEEAISYQIPTFRLKGRYLVYFAAYKKHIGLYPVPVGNAAFGEQLSAYASGKGTARFPLDEPVPFDLIAAIVRFNAKERLERAEAKGKEGLYAASRAPAP